METAESKIITGFLKINAPKIPLTDEPMFRLVWSDDTYELRKAVLRDYIGETFIREREVTERILKYNWIKARWIFEQWYPPELVINEELPESNKGSFEPLYVFEDKNGKALPLNQLVIELLLYHTCGRPKSSPDKIRIAIQDEMAEKEAKLDKETEEGLDVSTDIQSNLHFGEGIIVPSNYPVESPNLRGKENDTLQ